MKTKCIQIITACVFIAILSCNTEKTSTKDDTNNGTYNNGSKKQKQATGTDAAQTSQNVNDTCTTCCDPLLEIDPALLIRDKNK